MIKKVFLDANLIISAFDTGKPDARKKMHALLSNDDIALFISPLIRYEVLRGVPYGDTTKYAKLQKILDGFKELNIERDISELSSNLYRYDVHTANPKQNKNFDKRRFDTFHFATATCNKLDIESFDTDIGKIEALYKKYLKATDQSK